MKIILVILSLAGLTSVSAVSWTGYELFSDNFMYQGGTAAPGWPLAKNITGTCGPVTNLGDINGDNFEDLAMGCPTLMSNDGNTGTVFILLLGVNASIINHYRIDASTGTAFDGSSGATYFGSFVEAVPDMDGDGIMELLIGSSCHFGPSYCGGQVFMNALSPDGSVKDSKRIADGIDGFTLGTLPNSAWFGRSGTYIDDLDGDDVVDLVIGAMNACGCGTENGGLYTVFLNSDMTAKAVVPINNFGGVPIGGLSQTLNNGEKFGDAVENIGDLNGDSTSDLVVGSPHRDGSGRLWILLMNTDGTVQEDILLNDPAFDVPLFDDLYLTNAVLIDTNIGSSILNIGDQNGDGYADILVGAPEDMEGSYGLKGEFFVAFLAPPEESLGGNYGFKYGERLLNFGLDDYPNEAGKLTTTYSNGQGNGKFAGANSIVWFDKAMSSNTQTILVIGMPGWGSSSGTIQVGLINEPCSYDNLCNNKGVCWEEQNNVPTLQFGNRYCVCDEHFAGTFCEVNCNTGVRDNIDGSTCNCTGTGFEGTKCNKDVDDCASSPCMNEGSCTDEGVNLYSCDCSGTSYLGAQCELGICSLRADICQNNGTCIAIAESGFNATFVCNCTTASGFEGEFCQTDIDDCASSPCENGGTCIDEGTNSFSCICNDTGFHDLTCSVDVNDCHSDPCQNEGTCKDKGANKFQCTCNSFWEGKTCDVNIDDCATNACQNEAICVDGLGNYTCNCTLAGYEGEFCDMESDECASSPCEHDGVCIDLFLDFSCDCTDLAYEGDLCEIYIPCLSVECQNGGSCDNDVCLCPSDYMGEFCETLLLVNNASKPIVLEISFASFVRGNDTADSFALELPMLLAEATPGTLASDFQVRLLESEGQITYEVTFQNFQELDFAQVQDAVQNAPFVEERINGDVVVVSPVEEEDDDEKKEEEDMTWLIILLVFVGIALAAGGGYVAKKYHDKQQASSKLGTFKADKMNMPL